MKWSLFNRFLVPLTITIVLGMGSVAYIAFYVSQTALQNTMRQQLEQLNERVATQIDAWLTDLQLKVEQNSQQSDFIDVLLNPHDEHILEKATTILRSQKERFNYVHVAIIDRYGMTRASSNEGVAGVKEYGDRGYFQESMTGKTAISEVLKSRVTGEPVIVIAAPIHHQQSILGISFITVDLGQFTKKFVTPVQVGEKGFAYIVDAGGIFLAHPDKDRILAENIQDAPYGEALLSQKQDFLEYTVEQHQEIANLSEVAQTGWIVVVTATENDIFAPVQILRERILQVSGVTILIIIAIIWLVVRSVVKPTVKSIQFAKAVANGELQSQLAVRAGGEIGELAEALHDMQKKIQSVLNDMNTLIEAIQAGKLEYRGSVKKYQGTWKELLGKMNNLIEAFVEPISMTATSLDRISKGDIPAPITAVYNGDFDEMKEHLNIMIRTLGDFTLSIRSAAEQVATGSRELSRSAEQISNGASKQAATAEEVSSTMEQITANIRQSAENAQQTEKIAIKSAKDAEEGRNAVLSTVQAIKEIAEKIRVIEDIANQTHMLSLNATIEASKSQDHGKGFAVVASEVRSLAERSRVAAEQINKLANSSVTVAESAGTRLDQLVPNIQKTAMLVQEISAAAHEQKTGSEQINLAIQQLDQTIQQNAAISEESAATSIELSQQAEQLRKTIAFFTITEAPQEEVVVGNDWDNILDLLETLPDREQRAKLLKSLGNIMHQDQAPGTVSRPSTSGTEVKKAEEGEKQAREEEHASQIQQEDEEENEQAPHDEWDEEFERF